MSRWQRRAEGAGPSAEVAMLATFLLGMLALHERALAGALGVIVAVTLAGKARLHAMARHWLSERELHDLLILATAVFVVLPLLPDRAVDPWQVLNLRKLWQLAVSIMAIASLGYIALRVFGSRLGLGLAGLAGGFVSSTATIAGMPRAVRPAQALNDLREMLARTLGERIRVTTECLRNVPQIHVDPAEFDTALVNLAVNARDAMPRGGQLTLSVSVEHIEGAHASPKMPAGTYVAFRVADTGMGMTPEVQARALEPFFTTKELGKGSGLGLSMVYGFVKQSGGYLSVDSQLGYGTRISLYFPALENVASHEPAAMKAPVRHGQETILVVEDEPEVRAIALAFLRSLGYATREADSAAAALAQLENHPDIDLLFSDVVLGNGLTGAELVKAARGLRPGLPVLLTSGYERGSLDADDLSAQGVELLRKPYRIEQLSASLRHDGRHRRGVRILALQQDRRGHVADREHPHRHFFLAPAADHHQAADLVAVHDARRLPQALRGVGLDHPVGGDVSGKHGGVPRWIRRGTCAAGAPRILMQVNRLDGVGSGRDVPGQRCARLCRLSRRRCTSSRSMTWETPGVFSSKTRKAWRMASCATVPQMSTVPRCTETWTAAWASQGC